MFKLNFDRPNDPVPLAAELAIKRAKLIVNLPVKALLLGGVIFALLLLLVNENWAVIAAVCSMIFGFIAAWLWWSYSTPKWRIWALSRGADSSKLQTLGQEAGIVWPKGHIFEKTEFRDKDS